MWFILFKCEDKFYSGIGEDIMDIDDSNSSDDMTEEEKVLLEKVRDFLKERLQKKVLFMS